jgi:hypothetical protein
MILKSLSEIIITYTAALIDLDPTLDEIYENDEYMYHMIQNFDSCPPIKITADGRLIDGHHRYSAAKWLGLDQVPCEIYPDDYENSD